MSSPSRGKTGMLPNLLARMSYWQTFVLMLVAGSLTVFSFAPFGLWPLQIFGMALLFSQLAQPQIKEVPRRAAWLAWAYSFSWLFACTSWLLIAMVRYGGLPIPLAVAALALLCTGLAAYAALSTAVGLWMQRHWQLSEATLLVVVFPGLWMLNEWLRGWVLTGFPWSIAGYAYTNTVLAGFAPVVGVYGLSLLSAVLSGIVAWLAISAYSRTRLIVAATLTLSIGGAGALLQIVQWTHPTGKPLSVRLLQGNVEQDMKFDPAHLNESLLLYRDMLTAAPADLIVTPETAFPIVTSALPQDFLPRLNAFAQQTHSALLLGLVIQDGPERYTNSLLGFSAQHASQAYRYDKHHLVPFGEFIPFGFRWFVRLMQIPMGDLATAGILQPPMAVKDQFVMPDICYESLFGEEIASQLEHQMSSGQPVASILLNASNLAWYGDSVAMPQHLQFAQMRVLETGRPWLGATNTGSTVIIDTHAQIQAQLPNLQRGTLQASVQGYGGATPYIVWGNWGILLLALFGVMGACGWSHRVAQSSSTS
ncbi:apolipoprotein N-acyltransferase [Undibacterium sp. RuRC25W]|uniref:apolipoprotein N-acyltransferase n=1 Tax=Undibacterium sp. RuRC25W TaxID=3413047 RepID=UPI003BF2E432